MSVSPGTSSPATRRSRLAGRLLSMFKVTAVENILTYSPRVLRYARPYWPLLAVSAAILAASAAVGLATPWPLKILIDTALGTQPLPHVLDRAIGRFVGSPGALVMAVVIAEFTIALVLHGLGVLSNYTTAKLSLGMTLDFRKDLFDHTQRLSLSFHDRRKSGMNLYRIDYFDSAPPTFLVTVMPLVQSLFTLAGMFYISFLIDRQLALLSLVVVPFLYYSVGYYSKRIRNQIIDVRNLEGDTMAIIYEALAMMRVVTAFGREDYELRRLSEQGEVSNAARLNLTLRQSLFSFAVSMTIAAGTVLVLGFGAREVLRGRLTVGQLLVVLAYIGSVYSPLETLSSNLAEVQQQLIDLHLGFELIDTEPDIRDLPGATPLGNVEGSITFEDVHFAYTGRQHTLQDISLHVPAGQRIAIVGPTGAGKSTLASLIPRFYQPDRGRVLIDGRDIQSVTVKSLRDHVSIVLQESLLFSTTIRDNIRYGRLDATDEEIVAAARAANAHDFIMALPEQYDADVGERGVQLSLGERQRIGIARAFLKSAPILILDEPTSSIDSRTEAAILDALERLIAGRTTILIAHRLSTLRNVDQIIVLHHGKQYESGTHEELMKAGGLYWQLYRLQSGEPYRRVRDAGLEV